MRAVTYSSFGPPQVLELHEVPMPEPGPAEILIRVEACGVSRADVLQRQGKYPPPPGASSILGLDVAGVVASCGTGAHRFRPGDRVCALVNGGGYAEFCVVPETQALPIPQNWSSAEAATLPENLFTVYDNIVTRAGLKAGEVILIHGGTSGIGSMAIMLARAWGAVPYATAGSAAKCDACRSLGAEAAINYQEDDFSKEFRALTGGRGADVVLDILGGPYLEQNVDVLAIEGRLALVATLGGATGQLPIGKLMARRGAIVASTLRARSAAEKGVIAQRLFENVWPLLPSKRSIRPVIDSTFPLGDAAKAHERLETRLHVGKIILTV